MAIALAVAMSACGESPRDVAPPAASKPLAVTPTPGPTAPLPKIPEPPSRPVDDNPLHLPARKVTLDPGRRVFTFPAAMIANAHAGSTLLLTAGTVTGFDGEDVVLEGKGGPSYKLNGGYVIPVPDDAKVRVGDAVLTEWAGAMKHAVVTKLTKDRVAVRLLDLDARAPEAQIKSTQRFIRQRDGLEPGNYAAYDDEGVFEHVLLVSPFEEGSRKRWFVLGFGGAATLVDEANLRTIPVKWTPKNGAAVWAEWAGKMRLATVVGSDAQGVFNVKFDRAGKPQTVGWGRVMPPIEGVDPEGKNEATDAGAP